MSRDPYVLAGSCEAKLSGVRLPFLLALHELLY